MSRRSLPTKKIGWSTDGGAPSVGQIPSISLWQPAVRSIAVFSAAGLVSLSLDHQPPESGTTNGLFGERFGKVPDVTELHVVPEIREEPKKEYR